MLVKAIRLGFFGHKRIKEGQFFHLKDEKQFSSIWMEKVEDESSKKQKKQPKKEEPELVEFDSEEQDVI